MSAAHIDCIDDVFRFVSDVIIFPQSSAVEADRFAFRLKQEEAFNAGVSAMRGGRFRVSVNTGIANRLFAFCEAMADVPGATMQDHVDEFAALSMDKDSALFLSYVSALVFVIMHEYSHVAAGHVHYARHRFRGGDATLGFSERYGFVGVAQDGTESEREAYRTFRQICELEADGYAFALMFTSAPEIAMAAGLDYDPWDERQAAVHRAMLIGCLAAMALLDALSGAVEAKDSAYPFPGMRIINLCSAYLRVLDPESVREREGDHVFAERKQDRIDALAMQYNRTIAPALMIAHDAMRRQGLEGCLPDPAAGQRSDFMRDILTMLGGQVPDQSPDGRRLVALSAERARYMVEIQPFRELDL